MIHPAGETGAGTLSLSNRRQASPLSPRGICAVHAEPVQGGERGHRMRPVSDPIVSRTLSLAISASLFALGMGHAWAGDAPEPEKPKGEEAPKAPDYSSPRATFLTFWEATKANSIERVIACFGEPLRAVFTEIQRGLHELAEEDPEWKKVELYSPEMAEKARQAKVEFGEEKITGDTASLEIISEGRNDKLEFVRENATWRMKYRGKLPTPEAIRKSVGARGKSDADQIRWLIPQASAMATAEFDRIARATIVRECPNPEFPNPSLTCVLISRKWGDPGLPKHLRWTGEVVKPSDLAKENHRAIPFLSGRNISFPPYATLLHADRITEFTCDVKGDTATGAVSFRVPELYEGNVDYVALRKEGRWRIEEFLLPGLSLKVVRQGTATGTWKLEELKGKDG